MGDANDDNVWVYGAVLNLFGSVAINFGTNVMKLGHAKNDELVADGGAPKKWYKSTTWLTGTAFFSIGNVVNFISFGFAAQSLLSALSSIQFVTNVIFASYLHHERITKRVLLGTFWIVLGNCFIVVFAHSDTPEYSADQLLELYVRDSYIIYICCLFVGLLAMQALYMNVSGTLRNKTWDISSNQTRSSSIKRHLYLPVLYALVSAMIGTQSVMLAKSASILIRTSIADSNQLNGPAIYVVLSFWAITMAFWLHRMNSALRSYDGILIIPLLQVAWILFSIIGGGIYFCEFDDFEAVEAVGFSIGLVMIVAGVYVLSSGKAAVQRSGLLELGPADIQREQTLSSELGHTPRSSIMSLLAPDLILWEQQHPDCSSVHDPIDHVSIGTLVDKADHITGQPDKDARGAKL
ncbi:unnamed protein product (mitochondrion) [Plasmodiophora brassicae]|uniref:Magnesium transporter n=1 Tax=Plasmodiophora brassicae TaxID=37360 RepID=A0A0G4IQ38_PLABS|nr:hypothetical protein PBRA_000672 [Plasmodiophora brassicae]SPQ97634.1 unnamed protein product [Plasmodiophora brassicae]